jgi:hypothetical protein
MERALRQQVNLQGRTKGWLFQCRRGTYLKFGWYDPTIQTLINAARDLHTGLMPEIVETGDFSLWRSPRQGAVL